MLNTPSGKPASFNNIAIRVNVSGTFSDGLMIIQLPKAIALGIVQLGTIAGKLNGTIDATTPRGILSVLHSTPLLTSSTSPVISWGNEQANSVSSIHFSISAVASLIVFPFSSLINSDSSFKFCSNKNLYRKKICTLSLIGIFDHFG